LKGNIKATELLCRFFFVVHLSSLACLLGYLLCSVYNLLWILHPRLNSLRSLLTGCHRSSGIDLTQASVTRPRVRLDLYFDPASRDFRLLLEILAESSGLVQSLRILAMLTGELGRLPDC